MCKNKTMIVGAAVMVAAAEEAVSVLVKEHIVRKILT